MSDMQVKRRGYALGAEVRGVDLSQPLDERTMAAIDRAILDHIVLCFPDQHLEHREMANFCGRYGELHVTRPKNQHPDNPQVFILTNQAITINGVQTPTTPPVDQWHTDFSGRVRPATMTFLMAKQLPDVGGDTLFANMYAGYDALTDAFKRMIEPLYLIHDTSLGKAYGAGSAEEQARSRAQNPPTAQPVVRVHPESGRKSLYLGQRVRNFVGMTVEESRSLIDFLLQHATRYEFLYRHVWKPNDFVMWDNRCSMHFAVHDYAPGQVRNMLRCSIDGPKLGYAATEEMLAGAAS